MAAADRCGQCVEMAKRLTWETGESIKPDDRDPRSWCDRHRDRPIKIYREEHKNWRFMPWVMQYADRRYSHHIQLHRHYNLRDALRDADRTIVKLFPRKES